MLVVKIIPNDGGTPAGKLADAEVHFTAGPFEGLKLLGFAVWERRSGGGRNVTFPARTYSVNGERRSFALLRPVMSTEGQDRARRLILDAFEEFERAAAVPIEVPAAVMLAPGSGAASSPVAAGGDLLAAVAALSSNARV